MNHPAPSATAPFRTHLRSLVLVALFWVAGISALAQAASADYTNDLPSIARVQAEIKGSDPTDSLARQVAVFNYLVSYINRIKLNRDYAGHFTPGEQRMFDAYRLAGYQLSQDYAKSHTADEAKAFERLHGQYEMDGPFIKSWMKSLIGPQAAGAYKNAEAGLAATQQAHYNQEMDQYKKDTAAQQSGAGGMSNDPTAVATRRCLELGGDSIACMGKGFVSGFLGMVGLDTSKGMFGPSRAGVVLLGFYRSGGNMPTIGFSVGNASIEKCGRLADSPFGYTLRKSAGSLQIVLDNDSKPIVLTMRSDGTLAGPGLVTVNGRIITGYTTTTKRQMIDGYAATPDQCNGPCSTSTSTPVYGPATDRCTIGSLTPPPQPSAAAAASASTGGDGGMIGMLTGMMGTISTPEVAGLRVVGEYSSSSGMLLDFDGGAVTIDCGQAHVKVPYTVENTAAQFLVHVQNSGGPFTLAVAPDNTLRGSGSTAINGKLVSGMSGDNVSFRPHSETCSVATFAPKTAASSSMIAAGSPAAAPAASIPTPAAPVASSSAIASSGSMTIAISTSFPTAANPLAGHIVKLMTERLDIAMRKAGAPIAANTTPGQALQAYSTNCPPPAGCPAAAQLMHPYYVGTATFDSNGNATLSAPVPPGSYYVICSANGTKGALVWDVPVTLKAGGGNSVTLTALNAELVH